MTDPAPVKKTVEVPLSCEEAFTLFTEKMETWWPLSSHGVGTDRGLPPSKGIRVQAGEGGQVTEMLGNGDETPWGTILTWEPGARFRMSWCPGLPEEQTSEVDVTFTQIGNGCRVDLTHTGFGVYSAPAKAAANYEKGWGMLLGTLYARAAKALVPAT
ncbi:MAG: SRPBCC domain-containing protein [Pseudomonadota bacterium]